MQDGGVKGAAHIGVLKALEENNIQYDYICGTSSGSIVAALNAMGYKSDEILDLFKKYCKDIKYIDFKHIFKIIWGLLTKKNFSIDGLNSGRLIEKTVSYAAKRKGINNIGEIKKKLLIPAVDLNTGALYMFSSINNRNTFSDEIIYVNNINIGKAVRASCSYPGVFSPCEYNNLKLIDGGIRENIPWKEAKNNGADKVFCVKFHKIRNEKENRNFIDILTRSIEIMCQELGNYEIEGADYVLNLQTKNVSLLDCSKIDYLYKLGYENAKQYIEQNNFT